MQTNPIVERNKKVINGQVVPGIDVARVTNGISKKIQDQKANDVAKPSE